MRSLNYLQLVFAATATVALGSPLPAPGCRTDNDCSLNGLCDAASGVCACDVPWIGERCQTLQIAPGTAGLRNLPLCAYHGAGVNSTSWGGSVIHAPEDGKYYMWVAEMVNNCTMAEWETNSEVVLAVSPDSPLGPFAKVKTVVEPWAHNPQAIRAPDNTSKSGFVYALFTLGDGMQYHGQPKNCSPSGGGGPPAPPRPPGPPEPWLKDPCPRDAAHAMQCCLGGCMVANFTIFYSDDGPAGEYKRHTAQITGWPTHSRGRPWEYGPYGNWNPAPLVHPNGSVYLLAHTEQYGFKHGEAIIMADTWRGPYRLVSSDSDARWGGSTANAEDPFMWIDKRGNWHQLVEGNPMPGGHAWSPDGITWSNMSGCNGAYALEGCFNLTRPYRAANGSLRNVSYYTERPKLLLDKDGTPLVLYGTVYENVAKGITRGFTIAEPLGPAVPPLGPASTASSDAAPPVAPKPPRLYGLTRVRNSALCSGAVSGCTQLVSVDAGTGLLTNIGHGHQPLAAVGDLGVIAHDVYYYLGDGWNGTGTVLLGVSLRDGREVCRTGLPEIAEVGLVGGGQSLSVDTKNSRLVLTGLNQTGTPGQPGEYSHVLLTAPVPRPNASHHMGGCGTFTRLGRGFGDGDYEPMAHGTGIDPEGQRLFITLGTGPHAYGMGVVDIASSNLTAVVPMAAERTMWGPTFVPPSTLVGCAEPVAGPGVDWRTLDLSTHRWTSRPLKQPGGGVAFKELLGNLGSVRAVDRGVLYAMGGRGDPLDPTTELMSIDMQTGQLVGHAPLHGDVGWSGSILLQLAIA